MFIFQHRPTLLCKPAALASLLMILSTAPASSGGLEADPVDFGRQVMPVLSDKCFACHGPDTHKDADLRLDSYSEATRDLGGYRAIDPAAPEESEILKRLFDEEDPMPPEDADKQLSAEEREILAAWVRQGGAYADHWAFVPPLKKAPPGAGPEGSAIIDAFISEELGRRNIGFAPEADRATLARRVSLVLTGLPPEPEQLRAYLADDQPGAYERLVDELMAGPRYGEHQARYWLDAVRYGDTHGLHLDNRRGIYPYRDWVVRAFNENLPLNDFITWQLAGDLLPDPSMEQLIATGYVRLNPTTAEGGALPEEFQVKNNFDRTETFGTVFLGMTLTCARCHTHKYDPIPQTEYYRLLAFFNSTAENPMDGNAYDYKPVLKVPADQAAWKRWKKLERERDRFVERASATLKPEQVPDEWWAGDAEARFAYLANPVGPVVRPDLHRDAFALDARMAAARSKFTTTLIARDLEKRRPTRVLFRGEYNQARGEPLEPGILEVMSPFPEGSPRNRLGLAQWLTSRDHPLATRVLINRFWQNIFGEGLVRTPEDFGRQGRQPTHPGLLDWLAVELRDSGWDLKHMIRLMVTSRTFRQSSAMRSDIVDPENRLWARGPSHRLDAEVLRDIGLWAAGLLDPFMGGEGVKPYQPGGLWKAMAHPASNTKSYERDHGPRIYRRSLYVYWKRTSPHPMMTLFDAPSREASCVRRSITNTSLQSLGLLNETQRVEMARALAERVMTAHDDDDDRLDLLFTLLSSRPPLEHERIVCGRLLSTLRERYRNAGEDALRLLAIGDAARNDHLQPADHAAWAQLATVVLASDPAITLY